MNKDELSKLGYFIEAPFEDLLKVNTDYTAKFNIEFEKEKKQTR